MVVAVAAAIVVVVVLTVVVVFIVVDVVVSIATVDVVGCTAMTAAAVVITFSLNTVEVVVPFVMPVL